MEKFRGIKEVLMKMVRGRPLRAIQVCTKHLERIGKLVITNKKLIK